MTPPTAEGAGAQAGERAGSTAADLAAAIAGVQPILDGLADAAVVVDSELRPVAWNGAYAKVCALGPRRLRKLIDDDSPRCRDLLELEICDDSCLAARCRASGRAVRMDEISARSVHSEQEGDSKLIVSATPLVGNDGQVVAVLEIYRDVTAEARIQDRYKVLLDRERRRAEILQEQVAERTRDLEASLEELRSTRAQLIQSEKLSSLGQLIAGIAHEINNPINFVYGNIEFLQKYVAAFRRIIVGASKLVPEERRADYEELQRGEDYAYIVDDIDKLIASMRNGAERAATIVRDLRAFIHGGHHDRGPVNVRRGLETTINLLAHELKGRVEVVREFAEIPTLIGNESQLSQVFMNLLANAAQAIDGNGKITIRLMQADGGVVVEIEDDGVGISEEDQLRVFDPFFTTKAVGKGTGLGLSLSYTIIDGHGGRIAVKSQPGGGSTFRVWLPLSSSEAPDA